MSSTTTHYGLIKPGVNDPANADLWGGDLNDNMDTIDSTMYAISAASGAPTGSVFPFAGSSAPTGYLLCYGQAINRTTYATLFGVIGTAYGTGDGSTTFNLPDLRGRAAFGRDDMGGAAASRITNAVSGITGTNLGAAGGSQLLHQHTHTASVTDVGHSHAITDPGHVHSAVKTTGGNVGTSSSFGPSSGNTGSSVTGISINNATTGISVSNANAGTGSSQNIPPAIILNYIIKT